MQKLAIDFGTSNTLVAEWDAAADAPRSLRLPPLSQASDEGRPPLVPSLLYIEEASAGRCVLGEQVRALGYDVPGARRFFGGFKRAIAADVTGFAPQLDGVEVGPREAGELFLTRLLERVAETGRSLDEVVFTVPVQAFERYLHWLQRVAKRAGLGAVKLLDEPTAAALGYRVHAPGALVLVCDFGGGTLDLALVRMPAASPGVALGAQSDAAASKDAIARVIAKAGAVLGGEDIDAWLQDDFLRRHGLTSEAVEDDALQLKALAEQVKVRLSSEREAELAYFSAAHARTFATRYARADLEDLLEAHDFYHKLQGAIDAVLAGAEQSGVSRGDIAHVLLVGGTTLIPSVQRAVRQNFGAERVLSHMPFEAVAHGALAMLQGLRVDDHLYHAYGIRYWNGQARRHDYEPIFPAGQRYPTPQSVELVFQASRAGQPAIELVIGEMEALARGAAEVVFDGGRLVSTDLKAASLRVVPLNEDESARTLVPLEPAGEPGSDRLRVRFRVDDRRRLRLTADDLQTGARLLDDAPVVELR